MQKLIRNRELSLLVGCSAIFFVAPAAASNAQCGSLNAYAGPATRDSMDLNAIPHDRNLMREPMPIPIADDLDQKFEELAASTDAAAASIAIWSPQLGYWSSTYGDGVEKDGSFWWASVGKMATAAIVLQLIDEGKLSEETRIIEYFPDFTKASNATIGDLLRHTSGIFSFNADLNLKERRGYKSPEELIAVANDHPLDFCPGTNWNYSNTGYVMLARAVERIEEKPFAQVVEERIAKPLGLPSFRLIQAGDPADSIVPLVSNHAGRIDEIASVFGAGAVAANPEDMLIFLQAYLEHDLVGEDSRLEAVATLYPMFGTPMYYGAGIMVTDVPDSQSPTVWIGHSGGAPDAKGLILYDTRRDAYVALVLNNQASAESIANALLKALDGKIIQP